MTIDHDRLMALEVPDVEQSFARRDTILYALGLGFGPEQLAFVYEAGLRAVPSFAATLAAPGFWQRDLNTGIDYRKVVNGEQDVTIHRDLPVEGTVVGRMHIVDVIDKGEGKGAIVRYCRQIFDRASGDLLATSDNVSFCRGDGGFGGPRRDLPQPPSLPDRAPDHVVRLPTLPQAALIYRLSGDLNPLHADPEAARQAGFPRPILHGLATFGIACHALLRACCHYEPSRLASMGARFSAPVFPGETVRTEIFIDTGRIAFRSIAEERDQVVLQMGRAQLQTE